MVLLLIHIKSAKYCRCMTYNRCTWPKVANTYYKKVGIAQNSYVVRSVPASCYWNVVCTATSLIANHLLQFILPIFLLDKWTNRTVNVTKCIEKYIGTTFKMSDSTSTTHYTDSHTTKHFIKIEAPVYYIKILKISSCNHNSIIKKRLTLISRSISLIVNS